MKKLLLMIICLFPSLYGTGQHAVEGTFCSGDDATTIRLTKDHHYYYKTVYCTGMTIDSGTYSFQADTISFHSLLQKKDIAANFFISENTWSPQKNSTIDTLYFSIQNFTQKGLSYSIEVKLNDSLLLHLDALEYYDRKYYKFPLFRNSDNGNLEVQVNGIKKIIPLDREVDIQLIENRVSMTPLTDRFVYENDKMYSMNGLRFLHKMYYLYRQ